MFLCSSTNPNENIMTIQTLFSGVKKNSFVYDCADLAGTLDKAIKISEEILTPLNEGQQARDHLNQILSKDTVEQQLLTLKRELTTITTFINSQLETQRGAERWGYSTEAQITISASLNRLRIVTKKISSLTTPREDRM
jgi:DNA mismatch repair ATPase MutS